MKEMEGNKWKDSEYLCVQKINDVEISIPPRTTYRFNAISIQIPLEFFLRNKKKIIKIVWNRKKKKKPE